MHRHPQPIHFAGLVLVSFAWPAMAELTAPDDIQASDGSLVTGIAIAWNEVEGATGYRILRRFGNGPSLIVGETADLEHLDETALPGRLYDYFVEAYSDDDTSPESESDRGWRNVPPPTNLLASDGTNPNAVILTWSPVPGQQGYRVHRGLDAGSLAEIGVSNGPNYHDTAAIPGIVYTYMVTVRLAPGDSEPSELETGFRAGDAPSTVPTGVQASDGSSIDGVAVSWNPVEGAEGYRVLRGLPDGGSSEVALVTKPSFFDDAAVAGVLYAYAVKAVIDGIDTEASVSDTGWRNVPAPGNFVASDGTDPDGVLLTWDPVEGAIDYRVFRRRGNGNPNAPADEIAIVAEPTHLDTGTLPGRPKVYFVRARTEAGDSDASLDETGVRGMPAPSDVQASDGTFTDRIMVRWRPVPRSGGYRVLRTGPDGEELEVAVTNGPVYQDRHAMPGVVYAYRVAARAGGDQAPLSESDTGWMNLPAPTGTEASDGTSIEVVRVDWNEVEGAVGYRVLRSSGGEPATAIAAVPGPPFEDASAIAGVPYLYMVTARTPAGDSRASEPDSGFRNVRAPGGVNASDGTYPDRVEIVWNASNEPSVEGYVVLRQLEGETEAAPIGEVAAEDPTSFDDTSIELGVIGTYSVRARTAAGLSAASTTDTGFRQAAPLGGGMPMPSTPEVKPREADAPRISFDDSLDRPARGLDSREDTPDAPRTNPRSDDVAAAEKKADSEPASDSIEFADRACDLASRRGRELADSLFVSEDESTFDREAELDDRRLELEFLAAISLSSEIECAIVRGDLDLDGEVDADDLALLIESWWLGSPLLGDFDRNGRIDLEDAVRWTLAAPPAARESR
ncbi:MAG: hypothetical protein ACO4BU_06080 [Phycisphaerales bacterium]